ncbi:MAG: hypothetical protein HY823_12205 [Acidobacteria bacterium]|nr:hypothetical protein [Acidobacteriota bacterium]
MSARQHLMRIALAAAWTLLTLACASANNQSPRFEPAKGAHPENWKEVHWAEYLKTPEQCRSCHGSTTVKEGAGGVSGVSCFSCHPDGVGHGPNWDQGLQHGRLGAQAVPSDSAGMGSCFKCHGAGGSNGTFIPTCVACHTKAPHPNRPWNGATSGTSNHTFTQIGNATACAQCHLNGANSTKKPGTPTGTTPGCFNNTLCHGTSI